MSHQLTALSPDVAHGVPLRVNGVTALDRLVQHLGLPQIRFHDLRHISASLGLTLGESLKEVSSRLGHADIGITANVYGEVLPGTARQPAARLADAVAQAAPSLQVVAS